MARQGESRQGKAKHRINVHGDEDGEFFSLFPCDESPQTVVARLQTMVAGGDRSGGSGALLGFAVGRCGLHLARAGDTRAVSAVGAAWSLRS